MGFRRMTGVAKDGLIVPDAPLPDGAYVEITVPNAPREIVDQVRQRRGGATSPETEEAAIETFLRYHNALEAFAALKQRIDTCFPQHRGVTFELEEDLH